MAAGAAQGVERYGSVIRVVELQFDCIATIQRPMLPSYGAIEIRLLFFFAHQHKAVVI